MKISVLIVTVRSIGLIEQLRYLANQTVVPDEILILDGFFEDRKESVSSISNELGLNVLHFSEDEIDTYRVPLHASARNFLINRSSGDHLIFLDDLHIIPETFVSTHLYFARLNMGATVRWIHVPYTELIAYNEYKKPKVGSSYIDEIFHLFTKRKQADILSDRRKFEDEFLPMYEEDVRIAELIRKNGIHSGTGISIDLPGNWWWTNSCSAPAKAIKECGGFDEAYDGGTGLEDVDLGIRLVRSGLRIAMDPICTVYHVEHLDRSIIKTRDKKNVCWNHDRSWFKKDPQLLETNDLLVCDRTPYRICKCKHCYWLGPADSNEVLEYKIKNGINVIKNDQLRRTR